MAQSPGSQEQTNFLGACLVESDSEFEKRARKIKRRALVASIILQVLVVAALVLIPLLGKGASIAAYNPTILPPYHRGTVADHRQNNQRPPTGKRNPCRFCQPPAIPPTIVTHDPTPPADPVGEDQNTIPGTPTGSDAVGALIPTDSRTGPAPPPDNRAATPPIRKKVSEGVQAARLLHRVEPSYPPLARQIRREGRVELRAIIATDGRIKSLEVVSGEPLFIPSALSAVQEWRYQPTLLSGEPIEIETYVTVIYTLSR